jgi:hypothetical protein
MLTALRYLAAPLIRTRALSALALALAAALLLAACGGGGNDEDPQQVLDRTSTSISSGTFDLDLRIETSGGDSPGKLEAKLGGKFQGQGASKFPEFDFDVSLHGEGGSQSFSGTGGLISTGDGAFVNFQGTDYAVPRALYDEFVTTYAQLQSQNGSDQSEGLLQSLNINIANWLTDLKNDGTEDVEGTKTIHISGSANVSQIIDDLKTIATKAGNAAGNVDPAEFDQLNDTIESGDVDVFTGEDDNVLRRLQLDFELKPPAGTPGAPDSLTFFLQLNFANVNQPQTVEGPANAQPLENLLQQYGIDLGDLGTALRGGIGSSGALPESGGSTTAPSASATQRYQECLQQASGVDELQQCASLLGQ